jgi:hypothetical protein
LIDRLLLVRSERFLLIWQLLGEKGATLLCQRNPGICVDGQISAAPGAKDKAPIPLSSSIPLNSVKRRP